MRQTSRPLKLHGAELGARLAPKPGGGGGAGCGTLFGPVTSCPPPHIWVRRLFGSRPSAEDPPAAARLLVHTTGTGGVFRSRAARSCRSPAPSPQDPPLRRRWLPHLLRSELEDGGEGRLLWHAESVVQTTASRRVARHTHQTEPRWEQTGTGILGGHEIRRGEGGWQQDGPAAAAAAAARAEGGTHTRYGSFGSDVSVILKVTFDLRADGNCAAGSGRRSAQHVMGWDPNEAGVGGG